MKTSIKQFSASLLLVSMLFSCSKPGTDAEPVIENPVTVNFFMGQGNLKTDIPLGLSEPKGTSAVLEWTDYDLKVDHVTLSGKFAGVFDSKDFSKASFDFQSAGTKVSSVSLGEVAIKPGALTEALVKIVVKKERAASSNALVISGSYSYGGTNYHLSFSCNEDLSIQSVLDTKQLVASTKVTGGLVVNWASLATGLSTSDFKSATISGKNNILIDAQNNAAIYDKIKANLALAVSSTFDK